MVTQNSTGEMHGDLYCDYINIKFIFVSLFFLHIFFSKGVESSMPRCKHDIWEICSPTLAPEDSVLFRIANTE